MERRPVRDGPRAYRRRLQHHVLPRAVQRHGVLRQHEIPARPETLRHRRYVHENAMVFTYICERDDAREKSLGASMKSLYGSIKKLHGAQTFVCRSDTFARIWKEIVFGLKFPL